MKRLVALTLLAFGLATTPALASELRLTPAKSGAFPERAYLLTLPARASLTPAQVSVTENGAPVKDLNVAAASTVGQSHFGTVLLIEASDSMRGGAIESALYAARSFAQQRSSQQPLGVVVFNSRSLVALPLTTDQTAIERVLTTPPPLASGTHIFSAVSTGLQMLAQANVTGGAIILLSDGAITGRLSEQASQQRKAQVISAATAQNVRVYAIGVHDQAFNSRNLQGLAAAAGGTYTEVTSAALPALLRDLGAELSNQYLVSYSSPATPGGNVEVAAHVAGQPGGATLVYQAPAAPRTTAARRHVSFWETTAAALLVSGLGALLIGVCALALLTPRRSVRHRVGKFVTTATQQRAKSWTAALIERAFADDRRGDGDRLWERFSSDVELARIGMSPAQILALTTLATLVLGWLLAAATESPLAALLALCVPAVAALAIRTKIERQRRAFDEQLPDNLQVIASAMRAGHTFVGALALVAEDAPEPSRRELRRVLADEQLGVPLNVALNRVTERMRSRDFEHVALVAALQRETGGNTAEVIDTVTETIRERLDVRRLVRTLTAQGRLAGRVLSALPIALLLLISLINPHYIHPLFHRTPGLIALGICVVMLISAFLIIRRIVDIKI